MRARWCAFVAASGLFFGCATPPLPAPARTPARPFSSVIVAPPRKIIVQWQQAPFSGFTGLQSKTNLLGPWIDLARFPATNTVYQVEITNPPPMMFFRTFNAEQ